MNSQFGSINWLVNDRCSFVSVNSQLSCQTSNMKSIKPIHYYLLEQERLRQMKKIPLTKVGIDVEWRISSRIIYPIVPRIAFFSSSIICLANSKSARWISSSLSIKETIGFNIQMNDTMLANWHDSRHHLKNYSQRSFKMFYCF